MGATGSKEFWLEALRSEASTFHANAAEADFSSPVPTCPGWSVLDLVQHLGGVYRYVRYNVARNTTERIDPDVRRKLLTEEFPPESDSLVWWSEQCKSLVDYLATIDPNAPAWNWAPQAKIAGFWPRRMAHETAIHRWDIQFALHGLAEPIEARLAADGVSEVLDTWLPAGRRKGPTDRFGVVQLVATDVQQEWFLRLRGEGVALLDTATILDDSDPQEQVIAAGPASDLELALYGRVGFDVLDIRGDETLLEALRTG
ncbi:maleylpyruvate isomerase family mycothiol-dependent enzyme [Catelliglobosispora koreensis]|uniref:maleylpyruvate isomerase family mycothiol-dependent enzyme n=1 Tax=Catelliglobosispora koreensis TaxID=129052 RepID=UPI00035F0291|nr:maleylpyruvate isomerase family mycothiol-dependent enzyme [Catelliglobosispora koreensis]